MVFFMCFFLTLYWLHRHPAWQILDKHTTIVTLLYGPFHQKQLLSGQIWLNWGRKILIKWPSTTKSSHPSQKDFYFRRGSLIKGDYCIVWNELFIASHIEGQYLVHVTMYLMWQLNYHCKINYNVKNENEAEVLIE